MAIETSLFCASKSVLAGKDLRALLGHPVYLTKKLQVLECPQLMTCLPSLTDLQPVKSQCPGIAPTY